MIEGKSNMVLMWMVEKAKENDGGNMLGYQPSVF